MRSVAMLLIASKTLLQCRDEKNTMTKTSTISFNLKIPNEMSTLPVTVTITNTRNHKS